MLDELEAAEVAVKLDQLDDLRERLAALPTEQDAAIDALLIFDDDLRRQVVETRAQFAAQAADLAAQAELLTEAIKAATLLAGRTLKGGGRLQCVWGKPSVKWNDDKLSGYAVAHPEILAFRTVGKPSVSIR